MKTALSPLADFLSSCKGQKEVSLVVAKDTAELSSFQDALQSSGLVFAASPLRLMDTINASSAYAIVGSLEAKDFYDFAVQYPTGQIELWDRTVMQAHGATPSYQDAAVVFLITKADLLSMQNGGMDFLANCGLVFQS